ncbi:hypothetical protein PROFUN_00273 [Planoprotostelium fungivorum]|uniref:Protein kinase domain-containing protein n=1 Tax=Planoprotostelium fungivorum TaxID=1890364 RepID=A0A2P6NXX6_9EUKA|nr:hypothetical protein PROFUN_00273 [Planoprotostelium fungivorum]
MSPADVGHLSGKETLDRPTHEDMKSEKIFTVSGKHLLSEAAIEDATNSDSEELESRASGKHLLSEGAIEDATNSDSEELESRASNEPKKKRKINFTKDEDEAIADGVKKGLEWEVIVKVAHLQRTPNQIKERWRRMKEKDLVRPAKVRKIDEISSPYLREDETKAMDHINTRRKELEEEEERLRAKEMDLHTREQELNALEKKKSEREPGREDDMLKQHKKIICELSIREARQLREQARRIVAENSYRIGKIVSERHGTTYNDAWQDGHVFRELNLRIVQHNDKKEELEKVKRELTKKTKRIEMMEMRTPDIAKELENLQRERESLDIRQAYNRKEELDLMSEREGLSIEKNKHIREIKRINDEDASRWKDYPVLRERYVLLTLLGKGGFSEVYKAFDLQELMIVACKVHQLNTMWLDKKKENYMRHALRESQIHKSVVHDKIVRLYDVFEIDENSFCTVLEYCNGQDLDIYLKTQPVIPEKEAKSIICQIFSGLNYLNESKTPIIHYDLKPGNILFSDGEVKITDFGLSKIMEEDQEVMDLTSQGAGTYWYLPPECFEVSKEPIKISSKVDVWSAGVIFYQMLYGRKPFGNNVSQQKILQDKVIINAQLEFPAKPVVTQQAKDFIKRCLTMSQTMRPDVKSCFLDPYLKPSATTRKDKK